tara:strand:+ start:167 stop:415 length:249 start_codon:yes stop_codon:yes gene_type:complete
MKIAPMLLAKITHRIAKEAEEKGKNVFWAQDGSARILKIPTTTDHKIKLNPLKNGGDNPVEYERYSLRMQGVTTQCWIEVAQ